MTAENMRRDLRDNVAEIADRARDLSAKVKDRLDETYNDLNRTVQRAKAARRRADSQFDDARDPEDSSRNGGFQNANSRSPLGLPSRTTASKGTPTSRSASSAGLPMVAEASTKAGSEP